jgi:hypothetical protein
LLSPRPPPDEPGPNMPLADVLARYSEDLAAYPDER